MYQTLFKLMLGHYKYVVFRLVIIHKYKNINICNTLLHFLILSVGYPLVIQVAVLLSAESFNVSG